MIMTFTFDFLKLCLTGVLCVASLKFASQLKKIVVDSSILYGESDPHVRRLSITYWFVKRTSVLYIAGVMICNIIKPVVFVSMENDELSALDTFTWTKSWTLVIEIVYLITINT